MPTSIMPPVFTQSLCSLFASRVVDDVQILFSLTPSGFVHGLRGAGIGTVIWVYTLFLWAGTYWRKGAFIRSTLAIALWVMIAHALSTRTLAFRFSLSDFMPLIHRTQNLLQEPSTELFLLYYKVILLMLSLLNVLLAYNRFSNRMDREAPDRQKQS